MIARKQTGLQVQMPPEVTVQGRSSGYRFAERTGWDVESDLCIITQGMEGGHSCPKLARVGKVRD